MGALTAHLPITTQSFGTLEFEDAPALPQALELGEWYGVDLSGHRSRHVGRSSLAGVDLLIGFEETHVRQAVVEAQAPREGAFTFRGIIRFLAAAEVPPQEDVVARARQVVDQLDGTRTAERVSRARDDMQDPLGRSWKVYRDTAAEIRDLSSQLVSGLFGSAHVSSLPEVPTGRAPGRRSARRR